MNKDIKFSLIGINFCFSKLKLWAFLGIYLIGVLTGLFLNVDLNSSLFSPFTPLYFDVFSFGAVFHNLLYFFFFPVIGLFLGTSFFGFLFVPALIYFKGLFTSVTISYILTNLDIKLAVVQYGILLSIEIFVLIFFLIHSFNDSLTTAKEGSEESFNQCFKSASIVMLIMLILSIILSIVQFYN